MALYFDAVKILTYDTGQGSLKSRIYGHKDLKSNPAQVFALISETAKCDSFLKEVLDNADLLRHEPKLTPLIALLLAHDHFFSKSGIAAPSKHPIRQSFELHRARLQAEFTRARLRRKCASVEALKKSLAEGKESVHKTHPRWARLNALKPNNLNFGTGLLSGLQAGTVEEVLCRNDDQKCYHVDEHIPGLIAFSPNTDLTSTKEYRDGNVILQDKASCFPAHLLLGDENYSNVGDIMDGCAAPGNKTTHLAALTTSKDHHGTIFACERDEKRSQILRTMVTKAGASKQVEILASQDFLALKSNDIRLRRITHLLLDPSCSGSGILGREDIPKLSLPQDPRSTSIHENNSDQKSKKRKREAMTTSTAKKETEISSASPEETGQSEAIEGRLQRLSNLQTHIVEHAMSFPAAVKITYSTCSIHQQENEVVVSRVLASKVAQQRGWRILSRGSQVQGLQMWRHRGIKSSVGEGKGNKLSEEQLDACIRCYPDDEEGTMGFFVCGFIRDAAPIVMSNSVGHDAHDKQIVSEDDWEGFDD